MYIGRIIMWFRLGQLWRSTPVCPPPTRCHSVACGLLSCLFFFKLLVILTLLHPTRPQAFPYLGKVSPVYLLCRKFLFLHFRFSASSGERHLRTSSSSHFLVEVVSCDFPYWKIHFIHDKNSGCPDWEYISFQQISSSRPINSGPE